MGKCLSCLRINQVPEQTQKQQFLQSNLCSKPYTSNKKGLQDSNKSKASQLSKNSIRSIDSKSTTSDNQTRSSSFKNSFLNMPEKRSFYSRIPPLAKSAGHELRRVSSKECSETKIKTLFEQYKDQNCDCILSEGIIKLCTDLDVRPDDYKVLLLAWKFKAETMCQFTRAEFINGCKVLNCDTIKGIQSKFNDLVVEAQNSENFKDLYRFTFNFGLDTESGQRILPVDIAIPLWRLVFCQKEPQILSRWIYFLEQHPSIRGITKDTWCMFLNFSETVAHDLSMYDDTEAWPSLIDDFVEYENDQLNQNISKDEKNIIT